jgi:SAM-dependent methyltransferase
LFICSQRFQRSILYAGRDFYGPKEVVLTGDGRRHALWHGNTLHGVQWTSPPDWHMRPTGYYHSTGPVGDVFRARLKQPDSTADVAVIGLGAGGMAAYALPEQRFTFYEIDPEVVRIARDPALFTFLQDCPGKIDVVVGDGRLTLGRAPEGGYGMILIDAFSSDAIPMHLLTREAMQIYLSKLKADGILVFHVTNRYLNLPPLLDAFARDAGLVCRWRDDSDITPEDEKMSKFPSQYVVIARRPGDLGSLASNPKWKEVPTIEGLGVWTDQYTNIFRLLRW